MNKNRVWAKAYLPLAVLAAVQGLYIAATPSVSSRKSDAGLLGSGGPGASDRSGLGGAAGADGVSGPSDGVTPGTGGAGAVASRTGTGRGSKATTPVAGGPIDAGAKGDVSHCSPKGRQHKKFYYELEAPVCVAKWPGGDNGGATYQGVSKDSIKIVMFEELPNEQINAILASQDLAMTEEDRVKLMDYAPKFFNKYYETYGRKIEFIRFKSQCPVTPPDLTTCKAEARKVIDMKPFMVIFASTVYPELFDEWTRAGIISLGGYDWADSFFTGRRPYRYDTFMTGTLAARHVVEYYCKKLANKPATNAGNVIHPLIGGRTTPRKVGIIVDEIEPYLESARFLAKEIAKCDGNRYTPEVVSFVGDIDRAAEIQEAVSSKMINSKTTTVICWCNPLAMTGFSKNFTAQQYYPEHLLAGVGFMDGDVFGRLYDPAQWVHAFGLSHVADPRPKEHQQTWAPYVEANDTASYTTGALLPFYYMTLATEMVQYAGYRLTPLTAEYGLLHSPGTGGGGDPKSYVWDWGPGDYGATGDVREVWYDPTMTSDFDGTKGGYQVLNNHRRFKIGEWPSDFKVPAAAT